MNKVVLFFLSGERDYDDDVPSGKKNETDYESILIRKTKPQPCDKNVSLYTLNTEKGAMWTQRPFDGCERPYVAIPVANSNLVLIVMDTICGITEYTRTTEPREVLYGNNASLACYKSQWGMLSRKSSTKCISSHEREETIELCGRGQRLKQDSGVVLLGLVLALLTVLGHFQLVHDEH